MKKMLIIFMMFLLTLNGCMPQSKNDVQKEQKQEKIQQSNIIIDTQFFTVTLPESWKDLYDCDIYREDYETGYTICFYEKESRKVIEGGYLFGISLYEEGVDYSFLPSFDELGQIQTYSKTYEVIVEYPTDVQFNEDTADLYHQLSDQIDDILGTIEAKKGCQYIKNNKSSVLSSRAFIYCRCFQYSYTGISGFSLFQGISCLSK